MLNNVFNLQAWWILQNDWSRLEMILLTIFYIIIQFHLLSQSRLEAFVSEGYDATFEPISDMALIALQGNPNKLYTSGILKLLNWYEMSRRQ